LDYLDTRDSTVVGLEFSIPMDDGFCPSSCDITPGGFDEGPCASFDNGAMGGGSCPDDAATESSADGMIYFSNLLLQFVQICNVSVEERQFVLNRALIRMFGDTSKQQAALSVVA
jgi:hypothetical protein